MLARVQAADEDGLVAYAADLLDGDGWAVVPECESLPLLESIRPDIELAAGVQMVLLDEFGQTGPLLLVV